MESSLIDQFSGQEINIFVISIARFNLARAYEVAPRQRNEDIFTPTDL